MASTAKKFDKGKPRYDLIPPEFMHAIACMYGMGALKYTERNWEKGSGLGFMRMFAAMMRHGWAFIRGERYDTEDGQHHLLSVAWYAISMFTFDNRIAAGIMPDTCDDRPKQVVTSPSDFWNSKTTLQEAADEKANAEADDYKESDERIMLKYATDSTPVYEV